MGFVRAFQMQCTEWYDVVSGTRRHHTADDGAGQIESTDCRSNGSRFTGNDATTSCTLSNEKSCAEISFHSGNRGQEKIKRRLLRHYRCTRLHRPFLAMTHTWCKRRMWRHAANCRGTTIITWGTIRASGLPIAGITPTLFIETCGTESISNGTNKMENWSSILW